MYTGMADADGYSELTHLEKQQIHQMPQFYSMGVSLGLAYAHPDSGDTMGTVMYGGLKTVQNGPIKANTGQPVQWIFAFEARCFDSKGRRIHASLPNCIEVCPSHILLASTVVSLIIERMALIVVSLIIERMASIVVSLIIDRMASIVVSLIIDRMASTVVSLIL